MMEPLTDAENAERIARQRRWMGLVIWARAREALYDSRQWQAFERDMMPTGWNAAIPYMEGS